MADKLTNAPRLTELDDLKKKFSVKYFKFNVRKLIIIYTEEFLLFKAADKDHSGFLSEPEFNTVC
jgi:hypothetical protein